MQMSERGSEGRLYFEKMGDVPWVRSKSAHSTFSRDLKSLLGTWDHILRPKGSPARVPIMAEA